MKHRIFDANGTLLSETDIPVLPTPLDPTGALAALLVVIGTLNVDDAANAVGVTPNDLVVEAQAWAVAKSRRPGA